MLKTAFVARASFLGAALFAAGSLAVLPAQRAAAAASVTIAGSLQSELGCAGDWDPACTAAHLTYDPGGDAWRGSFTLPAGTFEYKVAIDDSWNENYGLNAQRDGSNIPLSLAAGRGVRFYYSDATHWVADDVNRVIATVAGSFQSELGCPGDWQPDCLRSWLQDPDGDGTYGFETTALPAGTYEAKVTIDESWVENYGAGGVRNGANVPFTVGAGATVVRFSYDAATHVLGVEVVEAARFTSVATLDGTVLESAETSGAGGAAEARATVVRVGDDAFDRQRRAVLSFNTAALPDGAAIVSATLRVRAGATTGTSPFATHGSLVVDVRRGALGGRAALQSLDFQASATRLAAATLTDAGSGWFSAAIPPELVNRTGPTQLRLRFAKGDDDDGDPDYASFSSGDALAAKRPVLEISYVAP